MLNPPRLSPQPTYKHLTPALPSPGSLGELLAPPSSPEAPKEEPGRPSLPPHCFERCRKEPPTHDCLKEPTGSSTHPLPKGSSAARTEGTEPLLLFHVRLPFPRGAHNPSPWRVPDLSDPQPLIQSCLVRETA